MRTKPLILLFFFPLLFPLANCKKIEKSSEKLLLTFSLEKEVIFGEAPRIQIDDSGHTVYVNVGYGYDLSNLLYDVVVSPLAQVVQKPSDLTNPEELVIRAEDGSEQRYTLIATQVKGGFGLESSPSQTYVRQMRTIYRCTTGANGSPDFQISMYGCDLIGPSFEEDFVGLILKNKSSNDDLAGSYQVSYINGSASCTFGFEPTESSSKTLFSPLDGTIEITEHDKTYNLISGSFSGITFKDVFNDYPLYHISGEFYNIPVE